MNVYIPEGLQKKQITIVSGTKLTSKTATSYCEGDVANLTHSPSATSIHDPG